MNVSLQIRLDNSLLKNIAKNGIFPDSLENVLALRIHDLLRKYTIPYKDIYRKVTRSQGVLFSLYEITVTIIEIEFDIGQLKLLFTDCLNPFAHQIRKINMVVH